MWVKYSEALLENKYNLKINYRYVNDIKIYDKKSLKKNEEAWRLVSNCFELFYCKMKLLFEWRSIYTVFILKLKYKIQTHLFNRNKINNN